MHCIESQDDKSYDSLWSVLFYIPKAVIFTHVCAAFTVEFNVTETVGKLNKNNYDARRLFLID